MNPTRSLAIAMIAAAFPAVGTAAVLPTTLIAVEQLGDAQGIIFDDYFPHPDNVANLVSFGPVSPTVFTNPTTSAAPFGLISTGHFGDGTFAQHTVDIIGGNLYGSPATVEWRFVDPQNPGAPRPVGSIGLSYGGLFDSLRTEFFDAGGASLGVFNLPETDNVAGFTSDSSDIYRVVFSGNDPVSPQFVLGSFARFTTLADLTVAGQLTSPPLPPTGPRRTLAFQDFEENSTTLGLDGSGDIAADALVNATFGVSAPGTVFDSNRGLPWTATIDDFDGGGAPVEPSRQDLEDIGNPAAPFAEDEDGDVLGVVDPATPLGSFLSGSVDLLGEDNEGAPAAGVDGQFFNADDTDGAVILTFDPVDTAGFGALELSFDLAIESLGFEEVSDKFEVLVNGQTVFALVGDDLEAPKFADAFATETIDLSAFDGQVVTIQAVFATNTDPEDIGFDNLLLTGRVPEPGAAGLAGVVTLVPWLRRRR